MGNKTLTAEAMLDREKYIFTYHMLGSKYTLLKTAYCLLAWD